MSEEGRFGHGLVIGKFYPPHAGHHLLIDAAAERCDRVTVVVLGGSEESIPTETRVGWLATVHASQLDVTVVGEDNDNPVDFDDPDIWSLHVAVIEGAIARAIIGQGRPAEDVVVDAVFSSEAYGPELGRRFGAEAVAVDVSREAQPISGTAVRADMVGSWAFLAPPVRADLALRVVVLDPGGGLSEAVADRLRARGGVWAGDGRLAATGSPVVLSRYDANACGAWPALAAVRPPEAAWLLGAARPYDLGLVSDALPIDTKERFLAAHHTSDKRWQLLTGTLDDQIDQAVRAIDDLVATSWRFVEPRS